MKNGGQVIDRRQRDRHVAAVVDHGLTGWTAGSDLNELSIHTHIFPPLVVSGLECLNLHSGVDRNI